MTQYLELGQIVNTFGIKGMVKIKPFTDDVEQFEKLESIEIKTKKDIKEYKIEQVKFHKQMVMLKLKGIDTIEQAETLRNSYIVINRNNTKPLEKDTYYIVDLIGLDVITIEDGKKIGKLDDIFNTGSNDIYVVKNEEGKEILLPAISDVIKEINLEDKVIKVHLLKGLSE